MTKYEMREQKELPNKVILNKDVVEHFVYDDSDVDDETLQECIDKYLYNKYGCKVSDYKYKCHYSKYGADAKLIGIDIHNIEWANTQSMVITDRFGRDIKVVDTIVTRPAANSSAYLLVCEVGNIKTKRDGTKVAELYCDHDAIKRESYQIIKLEKLD